MDLQHGLECYWSTPIFSPMRLLGQTPFLTWPIQNGKASVVWPNRFFGTTASHAAVLYSELGVEKADKFFQSVAQNAVVESGNKQVAIAVSRGQYAFGLTDTDDAIIEIEQGNPVAIVFPDQSDYQFGTLFIPNTLCITKGPNRKNARKLIDFLLQESVEEQLAKSSSAQIPIHNESTLKSRVEPEHLKVMQVDFEAAAAAWESSKAKLKEIFPL